MSIVTLLVVLILVGVALYLVQLIPMAHPFPTVIRVVVVLLVVLWLLDVFFGLGTIGTFRGGRLIR